MHDQHTLQPPTNAPSFLEQLNFLVTNRLPRALATRLMGKLSRIRNPLFTIPALKIWQWFSDDMRLEESKSVDFRSLHECFTRTLKEGARPIASGLKTVVSPCDGVIGAHGKLRNLEALQIKGAPYSLEDLTLNTIDLSRYKNGNYLTLRIKSSMYHHMHAPIDGSIDDIHYISGDTWNVNPPTLKRVDRLFCRNERSVLEIHNPTLKGHLALIPVAAILVSSMRFEGLCNPIKLATKGANKIGLNRVFNKGDRLGNFEHGSTIVLITSSDFSLLPSLKEGAVIRMGQAIMSARHQTDH